MEEITLNKIDEILKMKKQVILYGVPGVGKTYLAKRYVNYLPESNKNGNKNELSYFGVIHYHINSYRLFDGFNVAGFFTGSLSY